MLGVSRHLAYDLINNGYISGVKIGNAFKIPKVNAHLDYTSKLSSAKAMVSGMALPESVNFSSKWTEISNDGGKN